MDAAPLEARGMTEQELYAIILLGLPEYSDELGRFSRRATAELPAQKRQFFTRSINALDRKGWLRQWRAEGGEFAEIGGGYSCVPAAVRARSAVPVPLRKDVPSPNGKKQDLETIKRIPVSPLGIRLRLQVGVRSYDPLTRPEAILRHLLEREADDYGRVRIADSLLRHHIAPGALRMPAIYQALNGLEAKGQLIRWTVGDREYGQIQDCAQHGKRRMRFDHSIPANPGRDRYATLDTEPYLAYFKARRMRILERYIITMNKEQVTGKQAVHDFLQKYDTFCRMLNTDPGAIDHNHRLPDTFKFLHAMIQRNYARGLELYTAGSPELLGPDFAVIIELATGQPMEHWVKICQRSTVPLRPDGPVVRRDIPPGVNVRTVKNCLVLTDQEALSVAPVGEGFIPTDDDILLAVEDEALQQIKLHVPFCPRRLEHIREIEARLKAQIKSAEVFKSTDGISYQELFALWRRFGRSMETIPGYLQVFTALDRTGWFAERFRQMNEEAEAARATAAPFDWSEFGED